MTITAPTPAVTRRAIDPLPTRTILDAPTLARLGLAIAADGIEAHEDAARMLVAAASRKGLPAILTQILADRREPSVARQRAFGRLALALTD